VNRAAYGGDARWFERAAFLGERIADLGAIDQRDLMASRSARDAGELESAWMRNSASGDSRRFERRLDSLGLTRADLGWLAAPRWPDPPAWALVADEVAQRARVASNDVDWDLDDRIPFGSLLQPWADWALDQLSQRVEQDVGQLRGSFERGIRVRLRRCGEPAILDLFKRSGLRYRAWTVEQLATGYADMFAAVPVWGRLAAQGVSLWVDAMAVFFEHFAADETIVRAELLDGDSSPVTELEPSGDPHAGGRQVVIVRTSTGKSAVYKPRSLAAESIVAEAGRHLRIRGGLDFDPVAPVIDRGDHGWMGWIESVPPEVTSMADYSRRAGSLLALARALAITDLHDENLRPAGDRPVLVDLECLATARPNDRKPPEPEGPQQSLLDRSVLASDLLVNSPRFAREGRDMSGLTGFRATGEPDEVRSYVWSGLGTEAIALDRSLVRAQCDESAVMLDVDAVLEGLAQTERAIARHGLDIDYSRAVPIRVLVQDTSFYATLLDRSLTVKALSDGLRYSIEMERVARDATEGDAASWRLDAATGERELLEAHDVPLFTVDWKDTTGSLGSLVIPELVGESGTATIAQRLRDGTPDRQRLHGEVTSLMLGMRLELARQRAGQVGQYGANAPERSDVDTSSADPMSAIDQCHAIAEYLERRSVRDDFGGLCWLDVDYPGQLLAPVLTDNGLCNGNAGVAIFLAALASVSGESRWAELARKSIAGCPPMSETSLYEGGSGRGYALAVVGGLLDDRSITDRGVQLLRALPELAGADAKPLDVLSGLPGIAGALGVVATMTADESLGALALKHARISEQAWRTAMSGGWQEQLEALRIGVAHGITGIQLCMSRVYEATRDQSLLAWIDEMVEVENARVDRRNGVPARLEAVERQPDRGWCWGLAGYVMAREVVADTTGLSKALHAVEKGRLLAAEGNGRIDRLCCGRAAQADVLGPESAHLTSLLSRPLRWNFEKDTTHQNASLLRGVAGVGLTLLRVTRPGRVPQPLRLDTVMSAAV